MCPELREYSRSLRERMYDAVRLSQLLRRLHLRTRAAHILPRLVPAPLCSLFSKTVFRLLHTWSARSNKKFQICGLNTTVHKSQYATILRSEERWTEAIPHFSLHNYVFPFNDVPVGMGKRWERRIKRLNPLCDTIYALRLYASSTAQRGSFYVHPPLINYGPVALVCILRCSIFEIIWCHLFHSSARHFIYDFNTFSAQNCHRYHREQSGPVYFFTRMHQSRTRGVQSTKRWTARSYVTDQRKKKVPCTLLFPCQSCTMHLLFLSHVTVLCKVIAHKWIRHSPATRKCTFHSCN